MCKCCQKSIVIAEIAPKAIGPYSAGVKAGHLLYTAGQVGLIPETGALVEGGIEIETSQALVNLRAILEAGGTDLEHVVKTTVFLKDINEFAKMNAVYGQFFTENPPARSAFQVAALPKGAAVEIEAVAVIPCGDSECDCK